MKDCNRHLTLSYAIAMRTNTKRLVQLHAKAKRRSGTSRPSLSCAWTQPWGAQLAITSLFVPATVTKKQSSFHNPTAECQAHIVKGRRQASGPRSTPRSKCATTVPSGACRTECQTHRAVRQRRIKVEVAKALRRPVPQVPCGGQERGACIRWGLCPRALRPDR